MFTIQSRSARDKIGEAVRRSLPMAGKFVGTLMMGVCLCGMAPCRRQVSSNRESAQPAPQPTPVGPLETPGSSLDTSQPLTDRLRLITVERQEENEAGKFSLNISYPQLTGEDTPLAEGFNRAMRNHVSQKLKLFKTGLSKRKQVGGSPSQCNISHEVIYADQSLISVTFGDVIYYSGDMFGGTTSKAFNYDLKRHRMLTLDDLFIPQSNYLEKIADYCLDELKEDLPNKREVFRKENYRNWSIGAEELWIAFDAYQVIGHRNGARTVGIPYSALKEIIRPEGPLSALVK